MPTHERHTSEESVDAAIDLAVREMLDVEPRADLRARVIEHIERPRRAFNWMWVAVPLAAAAVVLLAVVVLQPRAPIPTRALTQIVVRPSDVPLPAAIGRGDEPQRLSPVRPVKRHERRVTAAATADDTNFSAEPPPGFAVVDALAPPPPIVVEQIPSAPPPAVTSLDIAPLQLPALDMNALVDSPRERREE
jgi:hypothetical protein